MSTQSIGTSSTDGYTLAEHDRDSGREPRYTYDFADYETRSPFVQGYLDVCTTDRHGKTVWPWPR